MPKCASGAARRKRVSFTAANGKKVSFMACPKKRCAPAKKRKTTCKAKACAPAKRKRAAKKSVLPVFGPATAENTAAAMGIGAIG